MADGSVTIDIELNNDGFKSGLSKIGSIAGTACKGVAVAIGTVSTAFAGLVTASVNARGELEQQIGGVQTLFANELGDASETVIKNANNAYKTAGMSAIDYMQTATSFSASLLQSLGGDTKKAAEVTDMAITDMSDNANKMGTSMQSIQDAYQGFAKQNYTMLDNLKLGYGGTKTEMERLLKDAQKISGIEYNIDNLSDVYNAVHVIQEELGITGTTAKEASETLQGSMASMKASWSNFLSGSGSLSQVIDTATDVVKNVVRIVNEAIPSIISSITESLPELLELGGQVLQQLIQGIITYLPVLMESAGQILNSLTQGIIDVLPQLIPVALQVIQMLITGLISELPQILQMGMQMISQLIIGIAQMLPSLIPQAVECIITLVNGLLDNIDMLIDAAIQLILGLAEGIIDAIPVLVEKAPEIVIKLVSAIIRNAPKILKAGVELIGKLIEGVFSVIGKLGEMAEEIINTIWNGLKELPQKALQWGKDMIQGFINGIKNMAGNIGNAVSGIGDKVKEFLHFSRPDKGPLRDYETWMPDMVEGLTKTLNDSAPKLYNASKMLAEKVKNGLDLTGIYDKMQSAVTFETGRISTNLTTTANVGKILRANINIQGDTYMDSTKVGKILAPQVSKTLKGAGVY